LGVISSDSLDFDFKALFPFNLDDFQQAAIASLEANRSVVVCVPTGSGKTLIGEYAVYRALARQRRVFYTTPLKALSNQKFRDFRHRFGVEQVGLLTGDISVNRDAPVLVMTTEIFRNMLYGTPIGEVGTSLTGVEVVVLDECHYMNDRQRGTVWEESIIYCPAEIQLAALSATIANSQQLTDWINLIHGPTDLIYSEFRPVPLRFHFCNPKGLFPLLNSEQTRINPRLQPQKKHGPRTKGSHRRDGRPDSPSLAYVISQLQQRDMLPAIYFIFSRRGCNQALAEIGAMKLVNEWEAAQLKIQIDQFITHHPELGTAEGIAPLYRGVAAHHAGLLPLWKGLVEELFQQGLIKVVFATETLAAGINMPARTTIISSLSKRTDSGHRLLTPSEFLQMAGRAGRRGMDTLGHVVTLQTSFEGAKEAAYLATASPDPLVSQFTPSYGMVLNLLQTHTLDESKELIERSFGQYLATLYLTPQRQAIADLSTELQQIQGRLATVDLADLASYQKLRERLKEEQRLLKILQQQADELLTSELAIAAAFALPGTMLSLKAPTHRSAEGNRSQPEEAITSTPPGTEHSLKIASGYRPVLPAVIVTKVPGSGKFPHLICLGQDNRWYVVNPAEVLGLHNELPSLSWAEHLVPPPLVMQPGQSRRGDQVTAALAEQIPQCRVELAPEVFIQLHQVEELEAQLQSHPAHQWKNPAALLKLQRRAAYLQEQLQDRQTKLQQQSGHHWQEFLCLIEILQGFGGLDNLTPTPLGQAIAAIRGDNELWLGLALMSGELDHLDPHQLAAACAALVAEVSRSEGWTHYPISTAVEEALASLRPLRRQLFQLQHRRGVVFPIWLEYELTGLVEQWALGIEWSTLCTGTSLDEGDIVRILRRALDFLSQLPHVPHLSREVRQNAHRAVQLINRSPINEVV